MPKPFALTPTQVEEAMEMKRDGLKQRAIASYFGLASGTMSRYLHPEKREEHRKRRAENNLRVKIGGKGRWVKLRVKKRPKPSQCELCRRSPYGKWKLLNWYHWNPEKLEIGMWLCPPCHWFVGGVERGLKADEYIKLKIKLEVEAYEANPLVRR